MPASDSRFPDVSVLANGEPVSGVLSVTVNNHSYTGADRFSLEVAAGGSGYEPWASDTIEIDIAIGLSGAWQTLISGVVDRVEVDVGGGVIRVEGRDFAARFVGARIQESFENKTSSEIVTELALRRRLTPNVTATTDFVGRSFHGDYTQVTLDQFAGITTEWDLLARLAQIEDFEVWVEGRTLNFGPSSEQPGATTVTPRDCRALYLNRELTLSSDLQVVVRSWDCRSQESVMQAAGPASTSDTLGSYVLVKPNLTQAAAAELALKTLSQIGQNGRAISVEMAGDLILKPRQTLTLADTNTDFDGTYYVVSVDRRLSYERGFTQTLQARTPPWTTFSTI